MGLEPTTFCNGKHPWSLPNYSHLAWLSEIPLQTLSLDRRASPVVR